MVRLRVHNSSGSRARSWETTATDRLLILQIFGERAHKGIDLTVVSYKLFTEPIQDHEALQNGFLIHTEVDQTRDFVNPYLFETSDDVGAGIESAHKRSFLKVTVEGDF